MQAKYQTDISRLAEAIARRDAKATKEAARRENRLIAIVIAVIVAGIAFIKYTPDHQPAVVVVERPAVVAQPSDVVAVSVEKK